MLITLQYTYSKIIFSSDYFPEVQTATYYAPLDYLKGISNSTHYIPLKMFTLEFLLMVLGVLNEPFQS